MSTTISHSEQISVLAFVSGFNIDLMFIYRHEGLFVQVKYDPNLMPTTRYNVMSCR